MNALATLRGLSERERSKAGLLASWFFVITTTLWLLKPIRTAALLAHLGSKELPYLRLGSVLVVGVVVFGYSHVVSRLSRLQVALGASGGFALLVLSLWAGLRLFGDQLGAHPAFVWAVFVLVDMYATVMVAIFWTYTNDIVSRAEADKLYAAIGFGGILGGIAGGVAIDQLVHWIGPVQMLLVCTIGMFLGGGLAWGTELALRPPPRPPARQAPVLTEAFEGARAVFHSRYLLWMVGIVVAYESAAALTEYVVNVVFERTYSSEVELAQMYGRLGWIVSATALASQVVVVPRLLPRKKVALLVPPLIMMLATISLAAVPVASVAIALAASDRGLNYSLQQVTRETLYLPLGDVERYKAKAFIDMFVDRAAKAVASLALVVVMLFAGTALEASLLLALAALVFWARCALALGDSYARRLSNVDAERVRQRAALAASGAVDTAVPTDGEPRSGPR